MPSPSLQCRHTLSGKLGSSVPLAVRRALGDRAVGSASAEDLSSISSCHSNLDNIQPPTLLEELDMDCSLLSVASLPSEAGAVLAASGGSTDSASASITSEAIRDMVVPAGNANVYNLIFIVTEDEDESMTMLWSRWLPNPMWWPA